MRAVGVIAEYNPFHAGHAWQLREIRRRFGERVPIVVAMSGCFCQRGIPALLPPRRRAEQALRGGADLVLLLPQPFAAAEAESFAGGGVYLLAALGLTEAIVAGVETDVARDVEIAADFLARERARLPAVMQEKIALGFSAHQARKEAMLSLGAAKEIAALADRSNQLLALEYALALKSLPPGFQRPELCLLPRRGKDECDLEFPKDGTDDFPSAAAIRRLIFREQESVGVAAPFHLIGRLKTAMPPEALAILLGAMQEHPLPHDDACDHLARYMLESKSLDELKRFRYFQGGLAERLLQLLRRGVPGSLAELAKSRNFSVARVRRALLSLLLAFDEDFFAQAGKQPAFIFPLGFNKRGRALLKAIAQEARLPVLSRISRAPSDLDAALRAQGEAERLAFTLYGLITASPAEQILLPPLFLP